MKNVVIWGAGSVGKVLYDRIKGRENVLFFVDSNYKNRFEGVEIDVLAPAALKERDFDVVYIATVSGLEAAYSQLIGYGVPENKINRLYSEILLPTYFGENMGGWVRMRVQFLKEFAVHAYDYGIEGSAAEVGVFKGDFAKEINMAFPDRRLFLFDTFEGFAERDLNHEKNVHSFSSQVVEMAETMNYFKETHTDIVLGKMLHPELCEIKKGYFPETFSDDIRNERFAFVSLDADLYQPIKAGLEIFYPLMSRGGVILVHDYFSVSFLGAAAAVNEFAAESDAVLLPIGDSMSVAIVKY